MKTSLLYLSFSLMFAINALSYPPLTKEVDSIEKVSFMRAKAFQAADPKALSEIIDASVSIDERNTAKVLLMLYFAVKGDSDVSESDRENAKKLRDELIREVPDSWQGMCAKFCALCETGGWSKNNEEIDCLRLALKEWDFNVFEKESAHTFKVIRKVYGDRPNVFRECLKSVLVNRLCLARNLEKIEEAAKVKETITDEVFMKEAENQIRNALNEVKEIERLKAARERATREGKPWPGGQAPINVLVNKENPVASTNRIVPQTE